MLVLIAALCLQDKIAWLEDYESALKQAREQKKLLAVHFWADW